MKVENYKRRIADAKIDRYLRLFGAVVIEGPKYCGKTWAGRYHANSEVLLHMSTGEESNIVKLAHISPKTILDGEKPRLIDEWQNATILWDEIRYDVDRTGLKGQYILTGSSTPNREDIRHSGAGRFGKIRLRTMSLYESGDSVGTISLKDICYDQAPDKMIGDIDIRKIAYLIVRGGFPANIGLSSQETHEVMKEYIDLLVDDDLQRLDGVNRDRTKMRLLLRSLARNESTTVSNSTLKKDISNRENSDIDVGTLANYLTAIDRLYLLDNDEPFTLNVRSGARLKSAVKRHFVDPSLACTLLNLNEDKLLADLNTFGFLFEALVARDLKIYAESFNGRYYHYQDYKNGEIDAVIELDDGSWCAFEIKLGANQVENAARNLLQISDRIRAGGGKPPKVLCVVCGLSIAAYKRPDGVYVVPITALKD